MFIIDKIKLILFPFLLGGTFIEALRGAERPRIRNSDFPSFWEGLSLRHAYIHAYTRIRTYFPSFWEGLSLRLDFWVSIDSNLTDFPSFWEGLSLRHKVATGRCLAGHISLPFGRDFH